MKSALLVKQGSIALQLEQIVKPAVKRVDSENIRVLVLLSAKSVTLTVPLPFMKEQHHALVVDEALALHRSQRGGRHITVAALRNIHDVLERAATPFRLQCTQDYFVFGNVHHSLHCFRVVVSHPSTAHPLLHTYAGGAGWNGWLGVDLWMGQPEGEMAVCMNCTTDGCESVSCGHAVSRRRRRPGYS